MPTSAIYRTDNCTLFGIIHTLFNSLIKINIYTCVTEI